MTLSLPHPDWVYELAGVAGEMGERMESTGRVSGVRVAANTEQVPGWLRVKVARATQPPADTAWLVAGMVAGMWPVWLEQWQVGLEVAGSGWRFRAGADLMGQVAAGEIGRAGWLLAAEVQN